MNNRWTDVDLLTNKIVKQIKNSLYKTIADELAYSDITDINFGDDENDLHANIMQNVIIKLSKEQTENAFRDDVLKIIKKCGR